jgi:malonyl CoA-acyl carrier protein transacylase
MPTRAAYLFPTFPFRQRDFVHASLPGYPAFVEALARRAEAVVPITPRTFDHPVPGEPVDDPLEQTLQAQYACYIENVAMGQWLATRAPRADYVAGYSMGMFSAACHAGALAFEDGLVLLRDVCVNAHRLGPPDPFAIGAVIGLTREPVEAILDTLALARVELTDVYSEHVILVAGPEDDIRRVLDAATAAGAAETRLTPFSAPFHTSVLAPVEPLTAATLDGMTLSTPACAMVSVVTTETMTEAGQIREELIRNVSHGMNWYGTIRTLLSVNTGLFLECGTSTHLTNLVREDVPNPCDTQDFRDFQRLAGSAG